jgi:hypothetical protein
MLPTPHSIITGKVPELATKGGVMERQRSSCHDACHQQ